MPESGDDADFIRASGARWLTMETRMETLQNVAKDALSASARVERAVMGYWDTERNAPQPGLWADVSMTKAKIDQTMRLFRGLLAGVWAVVLLVLAQFVNSLFGLWGTPAHVLSVPTSPPAVSTPIGRHL